MKGQLSVKKLERLHDPGRYGDGHGLYLQVVSETNRSWLFRYERDGRERWLGLGALHAFDIDEARERARKCRQQLADGIDPAEARKVEQEHRALAAARNKTFRECAETYFNGNSDQWSNVKHRAQFLSTLKQYAFPIIGEVAVADVDTGLVLRVFEQPMEGTTFWKARPETASRVRQRIETVLGWATVRGYRTGDNCARWRGHLKTQLTGRGKAFAPVKHHPALPYADLPAFMTDFRKRPGTSARALEFTILCVARTGATIGATWPEIDLKGRIWTVPPERAGAKIHGDKPRRVPLTDRAIEILESLPREDGNPHVFIGAREGSGLSNMAMAELMKGIAAPSTTPGKIATVHGMRSSFKDWATECTNYPDVVSEAALWHAVADKVERAYRRGELFEKRKRLMGEWTRYCASAPQRKGAIVELRRHG
jgi:integrase